MTSLGPWVSGLSSQVNSRFCYPNNPKAPNCSQIKKKKIILFHAFFILLILFPGPNVLNPLTLHFSPHHVYIFLKLWFNLSNKAQTPLPPRSFPCSSRCICVCVCVCVCVCDDNKLVVSSNRSKQESESIKV